MPRMLHHDRMVNLVIRALHGGAVRLSTSRLRWDLSGNCSDGYTSEVQGRPRDQTGDLAREGRTFVYQDGKQIPYLLEIITRCRKCENCRKARANEWRWRCTEEVRRAGRSWFGTLTLSPEAQFRMLSLARHYAATRAVRWEDLSYEERFRRVASTSLKEVTKYMKRVRKEARVPIRFICVTERHKSGLPHFHMLVHEVELKPVKHKTLSSQWNLGFEKWRLVQLDQDPKVSARYVTKYISKDAAMRIRASIGYGKSTATVGALLTIIKDHTI